MKELLSSWVKGFVLFTSLVQLGDFIAGIVESVQLRCFKTVTSAEAKTIN